MRRSSRIFARAEATRRAIIAEHGVYLRKACSFLCASHLGSEVVQDPAFLDPMQRYEELYTEYFDLYCSSLTGAEESESRLALLPLLKQQLHEYRLAILDPVRAQPFLRLEAELRRRTGDTQRLPSRQAPAQEWTLASLSAGSCGPPYCSASLRSFTDGGVH